MPIDLGDTLSPLDGRAAGPSQEVELYGMDWYDPTCYAIEILDAKYEKIATNDYVEQLDHLTPQQKKDLKGVLNTYTKLFDGTLGVYPHRKFHIDLVDGAVPKHVRPYPVSVIHLEVFKKELLHLVDIGDVPLERAMIAVGPGTGDPNASKERVYVANRALSIENVTNRNT